MAEYLQVYRARVRESDVASLLDAWPAALAEAQRLCPQLLGAKLVRLDGDTWLDVLRWSCPDGEERLMAESGRFKAIGMMHELLADAEHLGRGQVMAVSVR